MFMNSESVDKLLIIYNILFLVFRRPDGHLLVNFIFQLFYIGKNAAMTPPTDIFSKGQQCSTATEINDGAATPPSLVCVCCQGSASVVTKMA